jgi:hypothetical protein
MSAKGRQQPKAFQMARVSEGRKEDTAHDPYDVRSRGEADIPDRRRGRRSWADRDNAFVAATSFTDWPFSAC